MEVGVRELKNNLSRYLARVASGEEFVITDRGRPVASITPLSQDHALDKLIAEGLVSPGRSVKRKAPRTRVRARGSVSDLVAEQRR